MTNAADAPRMAQCEITGRMVPEDGSTDIPRRLVHVAEDLEAVRPRVNEACATAHGILTGSFSAGSSTLRAATRSHGTPLGSDVRRSPTDT